MAQVIAEVIAAEPPTVELPTADAAPEGAG
jgi:hypothetical protein